MTAQTPRAPAAAPKDVEAQQPAPVPAPFPPDALRAECEDILSRYPTRMAGLIPILLRAQDHYDGWISPEVEAGIAKYLELSDAHVRGVLTFYSMFNTQAAVKNEVWVCRTLTCWLRGAPKLLETALTKSGCAKPGAISEDGKFLVKNMECLGLCEIAPAVFVNGQPHSDVTPERMAELMDECE